MRFFSRAALSASALFFMLLTSAHAGYFPDVPDTSHFSTAVNFLYEVGLVEGNPDGSFAPTRSLNRAEFAKLVVLAYGEEFSEPTAPCFQDVPTDTWFAPYVCKAKELGLMKGDGGAGRTFSPNRTLNTAETLAVMDRLFDWHSPESQGLWYDTYLAGAKMRQVSDSTLNPETPVQRQLFAEIMARSLVVYDADAAAFTGPSMYDDFFSYDAITADDCGEGEIFDEASSTCQLDCTIQGLCAGAQQGVDELAQQVEDPTQEFDEGDANNILADYAVIDEQLSPTAQAQHAAIWALVTKLFPAEQLKDFNEFQIFSDGADNLLAAVVLSDKEPKKWVLAVDIADSFNPDGSMQTELLTETLIHEFAHVLTLRQGQLRFDTDLRFDADLSNDEMLAEAQARCKTYYTGEGCSLDDSYLWKFYTKFWKSIALEHPTGGKATESPTDEQVSAFYEAHKNQFVTEYAATNPAEDIAESFVFFVVKDKPTGTSVADKKVAFFWDYPELVSLRTFIRNKLR